MEYFIGIRLTAAQKHFSQRCGPFCVALLLIKSIFMPLKEGNPLQTLVSRKAHVGSESALNGRQGWLSHVHCETMKHEGPEWRRFRENVPDWKKRWLQRWIYRATALCLLNWRGRNVPLCQWCSAQQAAYDGGGEKNHTICSGRPYAGFIGQIPPTNCWFEGNKNPLHPCLFTPVCFMDVYVYMWKLCMLIRKLWRSRWNCWINSRWKEVRRIRRGEPFRSSQVRVKHMSWHPHPPPEIFKHTHK